MQQTLDGGYILAGESESGIGGDKTQACQANNDYWIVKVNAFGNKLWDKTFGGSNTEYLYSIKQTLDNSHIFGGHSASGISGDKTHASNGSSDYWVVKLSGNQLGISSLTNSEGYLFQQNQPNPFSENTTINYTLPKTEEIELVIYNNLGQTVGKLRKKYEAGNNQIQLEEIVNNENLKSGIYICLFSAGKFKETKRMVKL